LHLTIDQSGIATLSFSHKAIQCPAAYDEAAAAKFRWNFTAKATRPRS